MEPEEWKQGVTGEMATREGGQKARGNKLREDSKADANARFCELSRLETRNELKNWGRKIICRDCVCVVIGLKNAGQEGFPTFRWT